MFDTSKNPELETITLVDSLALTLDASVTRRLTYIARGITVTNNTGVTLNVYTSLDSDYFVSIPDAAIQEINVSTDYYRIVAVGTPTAATVTVDVLRSSIADSPTNVPDVGRALIDKVPIDARTEPYREIVQFNLDSAESYNDMVAKYPDAWNSYYETGAAPAYSPENAVKLQPAISFWLYMSAGEYIDGSGNLISPETAVQITAKEDHDFDPYNKEAGEGIGTLNHPQIFFDPKAYDNAVDSLFVGAGLNDLSVNTTTPYVSSLANTRYTLRIDSLGATDTFSWSDDGGVTWNSNTSMGTTMVTQPGPYTGTVSSLDELLYSYTVGAGLGGNEDINFTFFPSDYATTSVDAVTVYVKVNGVIKYQQTLAIGTAAVSAIATSVVSAAGDVISFTTDSGATSLATITNLNIASANTILSNSVSVAFNTVTGHTLKDTWLFNYRVSRTGLSFPFSKTVPRVQIDGTRIVGTIPGSGRNVQDTDLFSPAYLALTEYQAIRQNNGPKGPYDWGSQYATGKKTY